MIKVSSDIPLSAQAHALLRQDILMGVLPPETRLKTEELQKRYGLSSSPLREALSRLVQEGLVVSDERRGARVSPLSLQDFEQILELRLLVETAALKSAIREGGAEWEAELVAAHYRLNKVEIELGAQPVLLTEEWETLHRRFHLALLAACPNDRQRTLSATLFDQAERYRRLSGRTRHTHRPAQEHQRLSDATLARDEETAAALLQEHLCTTFDNVRHALVHAHPQRHE